MNNRINLIGVLVVIALLGAGVHLLFIDLVMGWLYFLTLWAGKEWLANYHRSRCVYLTPEQAAALGAELFWASKQLTYAGHTDQERVKELRHWGTYFAVETPAQEQEQD